MATPPSSDPLKYLPPDLFTRFSQAVQETLSTLTLPHLTNDDPAAARESLRDQVIYALEPDRDEAPMGEAVAAAYWNSPPGLCHRRMLAETLQQLIVALGDDALIEPQPVAEPPHRFIECAAPGCPDDVVSHSFCEAHRHWAWERDADGRQHPIPPADFPLLKPLSDSDRVTLGYRAPASRLTLAVM